MFLQIDFCVTFDAKSDFKVM